MATPSKIYLTPNETGRVKFKTPTEESAAKASEVLQHNHNNHHIFFNDIGFHNHIVHHILTLYGLGAPASQIEEHYKRNSEYQRPPYPVEERTVTDMALPGHFQKYMAQEKYYHDYVIFFQKEMEAKGWENVLNEYLFSGTEQADDLLTRLFAAFYHPLIHLGLGIEFRQPAIIAEALAQAAVHPPRDAKYLQFVEKKAAASPSPSSKTLLQLINEIRADKTLSAEIVFDDAQDFGILDRDPDAIAKYAAQWTVNPGELERKTAEMTDTALFFTVAAQNPLKEIRFDFFYLHCVTSSIFFPVFNGQSWLADAAKRRLVFLKGAMDLTIYASLGAPVLRPEEITSYIPTWEDNPAKTIWAGALERLCARKDDGHAIKFGRAIASAEQLANSPSDGGGFHGQFNDGMWLAAANMVADSVEAPAPASKWARGVGFQEAWKEFADRPGEKKKKE